MFYVPEFTGRIAQWVIIGFVIAGPIFFFTEYFGRLAFGYSKFADRGGRFVVPSRVGMLLAYAPAAVAGVATHLAVGGPWTPWHELTLGLIVLHFVRRCLETLFVHRYSGVMNLISVGLISSLYAMVAALFAYVGATEVTPALLASPDFHPAFVVGLTLWVIGSATNVWHHVLLARLRAPGETGYVLPRGGLFRFIVCPHYFGELIGWYGFALVFHHIAGLVIAGVMTLYLAGRAANTLRWYRQRFETLPAGWRRLVPFVY